VGDESTRTKVLEGPCQGPGQRSRRVSRNDFGKVETKPLSEEEELDREEKEGW
jgi:hypothetical protein